MNFTMNLISILGCEARLRTGIMSIPTRERVQHITQQNQPFNILKTRIQTHENNFKNLDNHWRSKSMSNNHEPLQYKRSVINRETLLPLGIVVALVMFIGGTMWSLSGALADFKADLKSQFNTLGKQLELMDRTWQYHLRADWVRSDMDKWAYLLEKANRNSRLVVPDPSSVQNGVVQNGVRP